MAWRKSLPFSPIQEGNNANPKVNVRAGLDNGAANTTHTLKHARSSYRKKKLAISLGGHHLVICRKRCLSKVIIFQMDHCRLVFLMPGMSPAGLRWLQQGVSNNKVLKCTQGCLFPINYNRFKVIPWYSFVGKRKGWRYSYYDGV